MEIDNTLVGTRLYQIEKRSDEVRLVFENSRTRESYILTFTGLLFESSGSALNRRVKNIQLNNTLGLRAITQLRRLNRNPQNYRQLYIQMEGSSEDYKLELFGALRSIKISPKRRSVASKVVGKSKKTPTRK